MMKRPRTPESGIVLMLVIWVIAILMVVALSLSLTARSQTLATLAFKDRIKGKFLAEAGIQRAITELCYMNKNWIVNGIDQQQNAWRADGTVYNGTVDNGGNGGNGGDGNYSVSIMGETGKIDLNMVPETILENLVMQLGVSDGDAETISDSIMDWKAASGLARAHGAGDDFYMSLQNPYKAKHSNFEVMEELLPVNGMIPKLLFGTGGKKGLIDLATVNSKSLAVNVNYAPREVLLSLPGMSPDMADQIINYRDQQKIANPQELQTLLGAYYAPLSPYLTTADTNVFTIEAMGYANNGKAGYPIRATVLMDFANSSYKYLCYKSPAYRY
ncbi:MAG: type II secretion system protein GspK [Nitrospiraceae bacterium]|nr:type II secretion system protein GspK [Nitrospiraceae bacterium]